MSGYELRIIDLDTIFEPLAPGDVKYPQETGYLSETKLDAKDKYAQLALGARYTENVGFAMTGTDLRDIFATKGSVPRFIPLPWINSPAPVVLPTIYRQPSRALVTKVSIACRIMQDGRCEITTQSPNIHSNPLAPVNDTLYALTSTPLWKEADVPTGVDFEVMYELVTGTGWTLDAGQQFNTWIRLTSTHVGTILRGVMTYNHSTQAEGSITAQPQLRIHLRRTDFPTTNKIAGVINPNFRLNVVSSLFTPPANWIGTVAVANTGNNLHNPDANTGAFTAAIKAEFNLDGTLSYYKQVQGAAWVLSGTGRWRRADAETPITDYDVMCAVVSGSNGTLSNPVANWTQVTTGFIVQLAFSVSDSQLPGTYVASRLLRFSIRQRSTRGYQEAGVVLPDNFVTGDVEFATTVVVKEPTPLPWPSFAAWDGAYTEQKTAVLNPDSLVTLSESLRLTMGADGTAKVSGSTRQLTVGTWLPAGVNPDRIEMRAIMTASGGAGSDVNELLPTWVSFNAGIKYLQTLVTKPATVGSLSRRYQGTIELRRKSYTPETRSAPLDFTVVAEYTAPPALPWPPTTWGGARSARNVANMTPESPNAITETMGITLNANGSLTIYRSYHGAGDNNQIATGRWLPPGRSVSEIEIIATANGNTDSNDFTNWTQVLSGSKTLSMSVTRYYANGVGTTTKTYTGTFTFRRKSWPSDVFSVDVSFTVNAELLAPVAPNWGGMSLPALTFNKDVPINYLQPGRYETAIVQWVMGLSGDGNANNVIGKYIYDTQLGTTGDGVDSVTDVAATRITPVGWAPSWFEWRYRVLSGATDNSDAGVWRNMANASFLVQVGKTVQHTADAGKYTQAATVAIDVRRIAYPSHTATLNAAMSASVTMLQTGPAWPTTGLVNQSVSADASVGQVYPINGSDQVGIGYGFNGAGGVSGAHVAKLQLKQTDVVNEVVRPTYGRIIPVGYDPSEFQWMYTVTGLSGGIMDNSYNIAGQSILPNTWVNFSDDKCFLLYKANGVTVNAPSVQNSSAQVTLHIRHKTNPGWKYTYPPISLGATLNYVPAQYTLWPRPSYQGWAGTYYHTTEVAVLETMGSWSGSYQGDTYGLAANWTLTFSSDGYWDWSGNGLGRQFADGRWLPVGGVSSNYSIRVLAGVGGYGYTTNITTAWLKLSTTRTINLNPYYPPAGEPNNTGLYMGTLEIRNDTTGAIVHSGQVRLDVSSNRQG